MKVIYLFLAVTFFSIQSSQAQTKISYFFNSSYAFNNSIELLGEEVERSRALSLDLGATYRFFTRKVFFTEIGLSGKTIFARGQLENRAFGSTTFRVTMPLKIVFPRFDKKTQFAGGFVFQNNVDFSRITRLVEDKYSWRVNLLLETRYLLRAPWYLTGGFSLNLRNIPDSYFINDPRISFAIGVVRTLAFTYQKKENS